MIEGAISLGTGTSELLRSVRDRVAVLTLNRQEARNSLSTKVVRLQQRQRTLTGALVSVRKPTSRRGASGVQVALPQPLIAFERRGCRSVDQVRKLRSRHWSSLPIKFL